MSQQLYKKDTSRHTQLICIDLCIQENETN